MPSPVRIAIVSDHHLDAQCLAQALREKFTVLRVPDGFRDALDVLRSTAPPDVILMDWGLPDRGALKLMRRAAAECPGVKVLVVGLDGAPDAVEACRVAGCAGYVLRRETLEDLLARIEGVLRGGADGRLAFAQPPHPCDANGHGLTAREVEILTLIKLGWSNKRIARRLTISRHTVKNHVHNLLGKLDVESRYEAASSYRGPLTAG
jgi:DNA-binding NarL/FixJ family response regulator